jgi:pyruvate/2-oxoglutarate/acetoin dehydrogenase E1 component
VDIEHARIARPGKDVTIVTYSASLFKSLEAATKLASEGIDCEVIDLRTLRPLDTETIVRSIQKTHRALVVDEGWRSGSISAEVSARIMENSFYDLDAAVERVCSAEVPMPYARHLEEAALPQLATIARAVRGILGKSAA